MDFWHDAAAQKRWLRRFALLTGLLLVPVFVLAVFARPSADDYIYAARTHAVIQQYGFDLPRLLKAAWDTNVYYYQNWQGLYVSGFTLAFQPAIFGNRFYGVTLLCVLLPLFFCLYGLARCVVLRLSAAQKRLPWALALLLTFAFIEGMPAPVEGLYWFNGAMNYLPYFSLAVLNAGLAFALCFAAQLTLRCRVLYAAAGCLCSLIIGGGHQVAGLLNLLLLLLAAVLCARRRNFWQLPAFAAAVLGLLFNVLAPGTRVRTAGFSGAGFAEAVIKSFILAAMEWIRWLDVPLLCLLALFFACFCSIMASFDIGFFRKISRLYGQFGMRYGTAYGTGIPIMQMFRQDEGLSLQKHGIYGFKIRFILHGLLHGFLQAVCCFFLLSCRILPRLLQCFYLLFLSGTELPLFCSGFCLFILTFPAREGVPVLADHFQFVLGRFPVLVGPMPGLFTSRCRLGCFVPLGFQCCI